MKQFTHRKTIFTSYSESQVFLFCFLFFLGGVAFFFFFFAFLRDPAENVRGDLIRNKLQTVFFFF